MRPSPAHPARRHLAFATVPPAHAHKAERAARAQTDTVQGQGQSQQRESNASQSSAHGSVLSHSASAHIYGPPSFGSGSDSDNDGSGSGFDNSFPDSSLSSSGYGHTSGQHKPSSDDSHTSTSDFYGSDSGSGSETSTRSRSSSTGWNNPWWFSSSPSASAWSSSQTFAPSDSRSDSLTDSSYSSGSASGSSSGPWSGFSSGLSTGPSSVATSSSSLGFSSSAWPSSYTSSSYSSSSLWDTLSSTVPTSVSSSHGHTHTHTISSTLTMTPTTEPTSSSSSSSSSSSHTEVAQLTHADSTTAGEAQGPRLSSLNTHITTGPIASFSAPMLSQQTLTDTARATGRPDPAISLAQHASMGTGSIVGAAVGSACGLLALLLVTCLVWRKCTHRPSAEPLAFDKDHHRDLPDGIDENDLLDTSERDMTQPFGPMAVGLLGPQPRPHPGETTTHPVTDERGTFRPNMASSGYMSEQQVFAVATTPEAYTPAGSPVDPYAHLDRGRVPTYDTGSSTLGDTSVASYYGDGIPAHSSDLALGAIGAALGGAASPTGTSGSGAVAVADTIPRASSTRRSGHLAAEDLYQGEMPAVTEEGYSIASEPMRESVGSVGKAFESSDGHSGSRSASQLGRAHPSPPLGPYSPQGSYDFWEHSANPGMVRGPSHRAPRAVEAVAEHGYWTTPDVLYGTAHPPPTTIYPQPDGTNRNARGPQNRNGAHEFNSVYDAYAF